MQEVARAFFRGRSSASVTAGESRRTACHWGKTRDTYHCKSSNIQGRSVGRRSIRAYEISGLRNPEHGKKNKWKPMGANWELDAWSTAATAEAMRYMHTSWQKTLTICKAQLSLPLPPSLPPFTLIVPKRSAGCPSSLQRLQTPRTAW